MLNLDTHVLIYALAGQLNVKEQSSWLRPDLTS